MSAKLPVLLLSGLLLAAAALPRGAGAQEGADAPAPPSALWHLPASAGDFRVTGEVGNLQWPVYVPAAAVRDLHSFQLAFQASIEVMPEASWLNLRVNGQLAGRLPVAAPLGVKVLSFDVPPGFLQPGWNAVALEVSQRHRVDCSLGATYELWTQVDAARTGFVGGGPAVTSLADLPAVAPDADGTTRIHLLLPRSPSALALTRATAAVERVALRGHYAHPVVDTARGPSGLAVVVGTGAELAGLPEAAGGDGQAVQVKPTPEGIPAVVVTGATEGELDRAVALLGETADAGPAGTDDGLKALARADGLRIEPGSSLHLSDFGMRSRTFSGRLFRESFDVTLPPDAYLADYGEARLTLDGGYAAGLSRDARLMVRVNGVVDGEVDFAQPGGAVLQGETVHMALDPFRPGRNRVEIEAQLPALSDAACDTLTSIGAKERFLLLGTSALSLPVLARVAQFPSLSATLSGGLGLTPAAVPRVYVPRLSDGAVSATATLLAAAAVGGRAPTRATVSRGLPTGGGTDPAIVVGGPADLPAALLGAAGLDARSMAAAWSTGAVPRGIEPADTATSDDARLDAWGSRLQRDDGWLIGAGSALDVLGAALRRSLRGAGLMAWPERSVDVTGDTAFVMAQGFLDEAPLTVVTARDDAALAAGAALLARPSRAIGLDGRAAALDDGAAGTTLVPARGQVLFRTRAFSLVNDRLVAAGWVSKHAGWYIGAVLATALALGLSTWMLLRSGRGRAA